jgi:hypothetical protein
MTKERRVYQPRIVGGKVMMPANLERLHKYMLDIEHIRPHLGRNAGRRGKRMARAGAQAAAEEATELSVPSEAPRRAAETTCRDLPQRTAGRVMTN